MLRSNNAATACTAEQTDIVNACLKVSPEGTRRLAVPGRTGTTRAITIAVSTSPDNAVIVRS